MRIDQSGQQKLIKVLLTIFLSLAVAVGVFTVVAFSIINGAKETETDQTLVIRTQERQNSEDTSSGYDSSRTDGSESGGESSSLEIQSSSTDSSADNSTESTADSSEAQYAVVEQDRPQLVENSQGNTGVVTAAKENTSSAGTQQNSTQQNSSRQNGTGNSSSASGSGGKNSSGSASKADPKPDTTDTKPQNPQSSKLINVTNIRQNPELPTGCETTSLAMLLNHLGYNVSKTTLADNYLSKQKFYYQNGVLHGADFTTTFAGDPRDSSSYGCYAPCIVNAANKYLSSVGGTVRAYNISGSDLDTLLKNYIDKNKPVLIWITYSGGSYNTLPASYLTTVWITPQGKQVQWRCNEHCVVLTGYESSGGSITKIKVSDPLYGNVAYDYAKLKTRFNEMGRQSVCIQ